MTVYYVNGAGNNGNVGSAAEAVEDHRQGSFYSATRGHGAGCAGVYSEVVVIDTPGPTWMVDGDGSGPVVIDLLYKPTALCSRT